MTIPNALFNEMAVIASRAREATAAGAQAFARLLAVAEHSDSGQTGRVAKFVAATYNGRAFPLDVYELRSVDIALSDDMFACNGQAQVDCVVFSPQAPDQRVWPCIKNRGLRSGRAWQSGNRDALPVQPQPDHKP